MSGAWGADECPPSFASWADCIDAALDVLEQTAPPSNADPEVTDGNTTQSEGCDEADDYDSCLEQGFATIQLHAGHSPEPVSQSGWGWGGVGGGGSRSLPIYATPSFVFNASEPGANLFGRTLGVAVVLAVEMQL
eukprot:TRINITY_DN26512_c0_g1_i1.p1 TRINITY_DN26512_c0_g1~~TRINITY_DN26512_c0_g1_i1.p1  ORF type:complete len:135 (-),score=21.91 TRINITY_DN26512_c0_g1_i1:41-445(-)